MAAFDLFRKRKLEEPEPIDPRDFCREEGARVLKDRIESYWASRGWRVDLQLHNVGFHPAIRAARTDIRSNMLNGYPRTAAFPSPENDR